MRTPLIAAAIAALLAPAALAAPKPKPKPDRAEGDKGKLAPGERDFQAGRDALLTGKYDRAIELLTKAVEADKEKTGYRLALARAYHYAGKPEQARLQLAEIIRLRPDHVEAGQLLAEIDAGQKKWKELAETLEPMLKYRHDYTTYHLLAEAKRHLGDQKKARTYYEEAVKLNPGSAADHYALGNIYLAGHRYALAAESYRQALSRGLDSPVLRYKLGSAYFNLRNYFGRITTVTVKSGSPDGVSGRWYLIEPVPGKKDAFRAAPEASAIYQIARAVADGIEETADIRFLKANIYLNARRYRRAYEMFAKIADEIGKADRALFHYYFAQSAFGIGKYDEYLAHLEEAIKLDKEAYEPTRVEAYLKVAEQHNQAGKLDRYIEYLAKAVAASPQTASLHLKLGNAYEEARRYQEAVVQWQMVLDLEPDHPQRLRLKNLITKYRGRAAAGEKKS